MIFTYREKKIINIIIFALLIFDIGILGYSFLSKSANYDDNNQIMNALGENNSNSWDDYVQKNRVEQENQLDIVESGGLERKLVMGDVLNVETDEKKNTEEKFVKEKLVDNILLADNVIVEIEDNPKINLDFSVETLETIQKNIEVKKEEVKVLGVSFEETTNTSSSSTTTIEEPKVILPPDVDTVIIEKIGVDMRIVEGANEVSALNRGAWRVPVTSTPDRGGNTVIMGHRYLKRPPSTETFWNLDKLVLGDEITIYWQDVKYVYKISEIKTVEPNEVSVLNNTPRSIITLITCTPIFTSDQRLVIIGELVAE